MSGPRTRANDSRVRKIGGLFKLIKKVGSGTYGEVWKACLEANPGLFMSVKQMKLPENDKNIPASCLRELAILNELDFPHIVHPLISYTLYDPEERVIAFAYEHGSFDVMKLIQSYRTRSMLMPSLLVKSIFYQMLLALDYIHSRKIIHCDVRPSNLIIMPQTSSPPGIVKLIDFNLARVADKESEPKNFGVVTIWYRAPELLLGDSYYDKSVDMWAAGCVLAELLSGAPMFASQQMSGEQNPTSFNFSQVAKLAEVLGPPSLVNFPNLSRCHHYESICKAPIPPRVSSIEQQFAQFGQSVVDLLTRLLIYDPSERLTAREALRHRYFSETPLIQLNISRLIPEDEFNALSELPCF